MKQQYKVYYNKILSFGRLSCEEYFFLEEIVQNIYVYSLNKKYHLNVALKGRNYIKYLDTFILILPNEYMKQNEFWTCFYTLFGKDYESLIDRSNNISCIEKMLSYINNINEINKNSIILDFGCGSGLYSYTKWVDNIVGYEPVTIMRIQAKERGLNVVGTKEFDDFPRNYFDAAYASFVFHMSINKESICKLIEKLKKDAVLVVNFYKDLNIEITNQIFSDLNFEVKQIMKTESGFGSIYEYRNRCT